MPGTIEALERLRAAGWRLGVVSNSDGRAEEALEAAGLRDYFEVVDRFPAGRDSKSRTRGSSRPRSAAWPSTADEALYVGDIYEVDVVGRPPGGMEVVLLDPLGNHAGRDVRIAASLADVAELVLAPAACVSPRAALGPSL